MFFYASKCKYVTSVTKPFRGIQEPSRCTIYKKKLYIFAHVLQSVKATNFGHHLLHCYR